MLLNLQTVLIVYNPLCLSHLCVCVCVCVWGFGGGGRGGKDGGGGLTSSELPVDILVASSAGIIYKHISTIQYDTDGRLKEIPIYLNFA